MTSRFQATEPATASTPTNSSDDGLNGTYSTRTASTVDCGGNYDNNSGTNRRRPNRGAYAERWPDIGGQLRRQVRRTCRPQLIVERLPIIRWAADYQLSYVYQDFMAGLTVGLTAIPQGIAYAVVAGLDPQYGLYSELLASFVYCVLGSCRNVTIGPTAIMALMVQRYALMSVDFAVLATFCSGCIVLALGLLNLGFLVQFISLPVTAGFTTAAALQIGSLQVKSLLGLPGRSTEFLDAWIHVFRHVAETRLWDAVLGVSTIAFLLAFKRLGDIRRGRYVQAYKYISLARNALAVLIGSVIAYSLTADGSAPPFALTGPIRAGFPPFGSPPFATTVKRGNETVHLGLGDMLATMGSSLVAIPFVAILEIIVVAKAFADGKTIDATQELIALGCCNIAGSFVQSMPVTGSFTRTAVNNASGVRTPFGGIITGVLVLLSVGFLTETFQYIPKATLAAVIITAMCFMMEFGTAVLIWRTRRLDVIPFVCTMVACLLIGLDYGIVLGIVVNLLFILYSTARPRTTVRTVHVQRNVVGGLRDDDDNDNTDGADETADGVRLLLVQPDQSLVFSAAEHLRAKILRHVGHALQMAAAEETSTSTTNPRNGDSCAKLELGSAAAAAATTATNDEIILAQGPSGDAAATLVVILDGSHVRTIDVTVARNLDQLHADLRALGVRLVFWRWAAQPEAVAWRLSATLGARFWGAGGGRRGRDDDVHGDDGPADVQLELTLDALAMRCSREIHAERTAVDGSSGSGGGGRWQ